MRTLITVLFLMYGFLAVVALSGVALTYIVQHYINHACTS